MKIVYLVLFGFCIQHSYAQKLTIGSLETILHASYSTADDLLKKSKFALADKKIENNYFNYYYTSYEKVDSTQLLRSLTMMEVFEDRDTSRFILYRTYTQKDQDELAIQLTAAGYTLAKRTLNDFTYQKGERTIINRIVEKDVGGIRKDKVFEFELGR